MVRGMGGGSASNVTHFLSGIDFPAKKSDLEKHARKNGAEEAVLQAIKELPEDQFNSMADVMRAYGEEKQS